MDNMKTTNDLVKEILQKHPETRNSDDALYIEVCRKINWYAVSYPFHDVFLHRKDFGFPAFETVRRTRQKIQAVYPELSSNDTVSVYRAMKEEEYRDYARKVGV